MARAREKTRARARVRARIPRQSWTTLPPKNSNDRMTFAIIKNSSNHRRTHMFGKRTQAEML